MDRFNLDPVTCDDTTPETRAWEKWAEKVRVHDMVRAAGRPGVVTAITDDFVWVRLDGRAEGEPFEWSDVGAYP